MHSHPCHKQNFQLGHSGDATCLAASPDGLLVATGDVSRRPSIIVWKPDTGEAVKVERNDAIPRQSLRNHFGSAYPSYRNNSPSPLNAHGACTSADVVRVLYEVLVGFVLCPPPPPLRFSPTLSSRLPSFQGHLTAFYMVPFFADYFCVLYLLDVFSSQKRVVVVETLTRPPPPWWRAWPPFGETFWSLSSMRSSFLAPTPDCRTNMFPFCSNDVTSRPRPRPLPFAKNVRFPDQYHVVATTRAASCCHLFRTQRHLADPVGVPQEGGHGAVVL